MGSQVGWTSSCELTCQTFTARERNGKRGLGEGEKDDGIAKRLWKIKQQINCGWCCTNHYGVV